MKQGKTISGILMGNKILNFENGILVLAKNIEESENINVWEQDIELSTMPDPLILPFGFNYDDSFNVSVSGQHAYTEYSFGDFQNFIQDGLFFKKSPINDPNFPSWEDSSTLYDMNGASLFYIKGLGNLDTLHFTRSYPPYNSEHSYTYYLTKTVNPDSEIGELVCWRFGDNGLYHVRIEKLTG